MFERVSTVLSIITWLSFYWLVRACLEPWIAIKYGKYVAIDTVLFIMVFALMCCIVKWNFKNIWEIIGSVLSVALSALGLFGLFKLFIYVGGYTPV